MVMEMAQLVRCLLYKHEDLSLVPISHVQTSGISSGTCNPSMGESDKGRTPGLMTNQFILLASSRFNEGPCFKKYDRD